MSLTWLLDLITPRKKKAVAQVSQRHASPEIAVTAPSAYQYPPIDGGIRLAEPDELVQANREIIDRLRLHAATDSASFETKFELPLTRLAACINALPATSTGNFSGEGGLFRAACESAFFCFQASDGRIFTGDETVERRHALEGRWRYVCFLAGMLYPIGKSIDSIVISSKNGQVWKRHFHGLTEWAQENAIDRLYASWTCDHPDDLEMGPTSYATTLINKVVGPDNLQWLEDGSSDLVKALFDISSGHKCLARNAEDVVITMWTKVATREAARRPQTYGRLTVGTNQGPFLMGAIQSLIQTGMWSFNDAKLKADTSGLYLVWPTAAADIISYGKSKGYPGWPSDEATIAALLKNCSIVDAGAGDDMGLIDVVDQDGEIIRAYKIKNPLSFTDTFNPDDFANKKSQTLKAILDADPLVAAEEVSAAAKNKKQKPTKPAPDSARDEQKNHSATAAVEDIASEDVFREESSEPIDTDLAGQPTAHHSEPQTAQAIQRTPAPDAGPLEDDQDAAAAQSKLREASDIRYSDLVPPDVRKDISKTLYTELLGKVMKAWTDRGDNSKTMRMTDNGAAFSLAFLTEIIRDVPAWVGEMASAGLIYSPPATPGLKVIKVSIPENSKPKECVVLSRFAVKKLGLS